MCSNYQELIYIINFSCSFLSNVTLFSGLLYLVLLLSLFDFLAQICAQTLYFNGDDYD